MARHEVVSDAGEPLILVDESDREIGFKAKSECHLGDGVLHRAFSIFIFNPAGELLLQRRAAHKPLWPHFWSNSCCSHPRKGESMPQALSRRLQEELGFDCELSFLYKFKYHAQYELLGSENEYCWVYYGLYPGSVTVNANEISEWRYVSPQQLDEELERHPESFTPWFKMEWQRITDDYLDEISKRT